MQILTPTGYRDIADCQAGDQVAAFDMVTGAPIVNAIETVQPVDAAEFARWQNPRCLVNGDIVMLGAHGVLTWFGVKRVDALQDGDVIRDGGVETLVEAFEILDAVPAFAFYRINRAWTLFAEQSIWRNGVGVCHARDLVIGDTIYDDADQPVVIDSIEQVSGDLWYRFDISGDHSYIVDGLTLHNASRFWVGGTGTWDASTTTHWASASNGAGGQSVPGSADTVTFDASSGGGTVTVNTTVTVQSMTWGTFTGTIDFSANNNNVTLSATGTGFSGTGTGARAINLGNGTWTLSGTTAGATAWNMSTTTNLTFNANSSTLVLSGVVATDGLRTFTGGGLTYNAIQLSAQANGGGTSFVGANTIANLAVTGPNVVELAATQTITTLAINGTSSGPILMRSSVDGVSRTISVASNAPTINYAALRDITGSGGASFVANNSFNLGNNSGVTINGPGAAGMLFIPDMAGT